MRTFVFFSTVWISFKCKDEKINPLWHHKGHRQLSLPLSWAGCKSIIYSSNRICLFACWHVANKDVEIGAQGELHNGYTSAERLQRRHTRLTSRPASLSYTQRGGSLSSSGLSLRLPQRDLGWERAKTTGAFQLEPRVVVKKVASCCPCLWKCLGWRWQWWCKQWVTCRQIFLAVRVYPLKLY